MPTLTTEELLTSLKQEIQQWETKIEEYSNRKIEGPIAALLNQTKISELQKALEEARQDFVGMGGNLADLAASKLTQEAATADGIAASAPVAASAAASEPDALPHPFLTRATQQTTAINSQDGYVISYRS